MILRFGAFELDDDRGELFRDGRPVPVEGRVFALLSLLMRNHDRLVSKDEIVDVVWDGRAISDSAISTAVKDARKAVGDDGTRQSVIRTVHGRGFRCACEVRIAAPADPAAAPPPEERFRLAASGGKPSIAVLPFQRFAPSDAARALADAIPAELISPLSRLRWIDVIARGSSFRFRGASIDPVVLRQVLGVRYCLSGVVELIGQGLAVTVELTETASGTVIWGERYTGSLDRAQEIRAEIAGSVIASLEVQVPLNEALAVRFVGASNLDAWAAYHVGLQHMYRFNRRDNDAAAEFFRRAIAKEPGFARAHAALSFTHFQNAFMHYGPARDAEVDAARAASERSLELDLLDPFANYNMGRVCWLAGDLAGGAEWLDRSLEISPNFAQARYVRGLMDVFAWNGADARVNTTRAMALSPLDPLRYAMLGSHAQSYLGEGNYAEASKWAVRGARAPGSHHLLAAVAAIANHLDGNEDGARYWAENVRQRRPDMSAALFFGAFPFAEGPHRDTVEKALAKLGF